MLKAILSGKDNIEQIQKINDIPVNPLFDSELELRFMEAIRQKVGAANVRGLMGVRVATMHRVKGLEFKYVFVVAVNNRIVPLPAAINHTDTISEAESITSEKCLLYVALTRAQKGAYITSYGKKSEFLR